MIFPEDGGSKAEVTASDFGPYSLTYRGTER